MPEGNEYWDHVGPEEMGGTVDNTADHVAFLAQGIPAMARRVMEIGCGMGRLIAPLAQRFPQINFLGFDPSMALLAQADQGPNIDYVSELPQSRFDFIYSMLVFQHINSDEKQRYIKWATEHLLPSGRFWFQYVTGTYDADNDHCLTEMEMEGVCLDAGVRIEKHAADPDQFNWRWVSVR